MREPLGEIQRVQVLQLHEQCIEALQAIHVLELKRSQELELHDVFDRPQHEWRQHEKKNLNYPGNCTLCGELGALLDQEVLQVAAILSQVLNAGISDILAVLNVYIVNI
jgi:hypothetical protein